MAAIIRVLGELTDELRRSLDFYLSQSENLEVAQILLAGPGGGLGQLDEFFKQRLNLPTIQVDPVAAIPRGRKLPQGNDPDWDCPRLRTTGG